MTTEVPELLPAGLEKVVEGIDVPEGPAWGPDGRLYFVSAGTSEIFRLNEDGSIESIARTEGRPNGLAFSADGRWLASTGNSSVIKIWSLDADYLIAEWAERNGRAPIS